TRHDARIKNISRLAAEHQVRLLKVNAARLDGMTKNARHQGVAARVTLIKLANDLDDIIDHLSVPALLLILDGVQDPHNLGACLRVADAFGVHAVIAPKDHAVGITPTVSKVACGSAESVPYVMVINLARTLRELKERGVWVIGADQSSTTDIYGVRLEGGLAWVFGAEGEGMRRLTREHCDELARIPMIGSVESLNVSVATGICLAETRRRGYGS
ncbi:MAG TPA: 23S rRNA (guanosine(2251)-2'-O)-methyltransferase RlmB, partial [Phycisphaerae bacterium]|nr:23S rRNA (guanosine(2251)-2'-O)-methyltransferase RlmB [Phycisphaerae bacterium]